VFDAFRAKNIAIAAYFSKPDWHCPWYWAEGMEKPVGSWRNPTYAPQEHPEVWEKYVEFTHNQMMELIEDYGRIHLDTGTWLNGVLGCFCMDTCRATYVRRQNGG